MDKRESTHKTDWDKLLQNHGTAILTPTPPLQQLSKLWSSSAACAHMFAR